MGITNIKSLASACTVNLLSFAASNAYSWSSTVLVSLKSDDPEINPIGRPITSTEESWIASLLSFGATFCSLVAGLFSQRFGRKKTLLMFAIPMLISHLILAFATNPIEFFVARFMVGLGAGCVYTVIPMYVGEIAETKIRGQLGCMMSVFGCFGHLFAYIVGPLVNLKTFSFILMLPILLCIFLFGVFVPESPYYYVAIGNESAAETSLRKLRRKSNLNKEELNIIKENIDEVKNDSVSWFNIWKSQSFRRGIRITSFLMIFQQLVGISVVLAYMRPIFIASGSTISTYFSTIIVAIIQIVSVLICSSLADKWGRKMLLILSSVGVIISSFSLGFYFFLKNSEHDVSKLGWLPILSLIVYIIGYNFGISAIPWALVGELFTNKTKPFASTITSVSGLSMSFLTTLMFPMFQDLFGLYVIFWFFAVNGILVLFFVVRYVPETKGKSFQEIMKMLEK